MKKDWNPEILRTYVGTYTQIMKQDWNPETRSVHKKQKLLHLYSTITSLHTPARCKPPRKLLCKCTFGAPDQGQTLDVWESQTTESALRWRTHHIAPHHTLGYILGFRSGSYILDWESCDKGLGNCDYVLAQSHMILRKTRLYDSSFCRPFISLIISFWVSQLLLLNHICNTCSLDSARPLNLVCLLEVGQKA